MNENSGIRGKVIPWLRVNKVYIQCFLVPFLIMVAICFYCDVEPFGDQTLAIIDALHQYLPFFSEYHDKLRNLESFFYSWNGGLGHNFLSLWAYYLSSPLNLLLVFLPKSALPMGFSWLLVLKISLTGLTTGAFLISRSKKNNKKVILFSTAFALSNYMIGYSWNIMWLDGILMLPLVLMGFDKLIKEKDGKWYALTLALAMVGNYYIAFMICIFFVLWFLFYNHDGIVAFIKNGFRFAYFSLLAACMAAIALLPAYMGLMQTASAGAMTLPEHSFLTNWANLFSTHLIGTEPMTNNNFDGNANLYIGLITVFFFFLYLFGREIQWHEKLRRVLLLGILALSFNESILNFIWHGFHDQYGIPNRFAFLYLFLIVFTGFEAMEKLGSMKIWNVLLAMAGSAGAMVLFAKMADTEPEQGWLILSVSALLVYGLFAGLYTLRIISYRKCAWALAIIAMVEIVGMSFGGFQANGQVDTIYYFEDTEDIEKLTEAISEEELVRAELVSSKMLDEATWHNLKSVGMFGSTVNGTAVTMMDHLGFFTGANEYLYKGATPLTNVLLNVKYNIRREDDLNLGTFQVVKLQNDMELLENPYETSIGYGISGGLADWEYTSVYPFRVQNRFVESAYGVGTIFWELDARVTDTNDCTVEETGSSGEYRIQYGESYEDNMTYRILVDDGDDVYIHYDGSRVENAIIMVGEEVRVSKKINSEIFHVGIVEGVDEIYVKLQLKSDDIKEGVIRLSAAAFDQDAFDQVHEKMMEQVVHVTSWTSSSLEGSINMKEEGLILFSIPYDTGWTVKIDGVEQEIVPVVDGLLGVHVGAGEHEIEMKFVSPGFKEGLLLTVFGLVTFGILFRKKKPLPENEDNLNADLYKDTLMNRENASADLNKDCPAEQDNVSSDLSQIEAGEIEEENSGETQKGTHTDGQGIGSNENR